MNQKIDKLKVNLQRMGAVALASWAVAVPAFAEEPAAAAPAEAAATESPADAPVEKTVADVAGEIEGLQETVTELKGIIEPMTKLKFSGYIQGRFEYHQDSLDAGQSASGKPGVTNQFQVRRGRLKATYGSQYTEFVLETDASASGLSLKDAEASLIEPWTGLGLKLTAGQFKYPFGYSTPQSDSVAEMTEKPLAIRKLFPGDRDRGARLSGKWKFLNLALAVVNGNGTQDSSSMVGVSNSGNDNTAFKDILGRVGVDFEWIVAGVSFYSGKTANATLLKGITADPKATPPVVGTPDTFPLTFFDKTRFGADLQLYYDVPHVGGIAVKGEYIQGTEAGNDFAGWYGLVRQNIGDKWGAFVRVDQYDPNTNKDNDDTTTVGGGVHFYPDGHAKISAVYEHPMSKNASLADPRDDVLTLQLQGMF